MKFQIVRVSEESFGYTNNEDLDVNSIKEFAIDISHLYKWNVDLKIFGVFFRIRLRGKNDETRKVLLYFDCAVHFNITNFSEIIQVKPELLINEGAEITLMSISFSTIRGMLATRTLGTPFLNFILPIVNPSLLIESRIMNKANKSLEISQ